MNYDSAFDALSEKLKALLLNSGAGHDYDHTLRVMKNAELLLSEEPGADREIVRFAALLHDCARPEEHASKGQVCHARRGAEIAAQLLAEENMDAPFCAAVAAAVRSHRYRDGIVPDTPEGKVLYDADKLDSLGAVGLGRAFLFAGACGARVHNTPEEALGNGAYGPEVTAYREYLVKLRHLPGAMLTPAGRRMGAERLRFMETFFEQLNEEVYGN
ncbi:MAG: HD domain-containing protein [Lentisphaeria bacterium]|nr:HD domain-containing protein [Lentisphaeria bacterium]